MAHESLQAIVGTAVIDKHFSHDLLNSKRAEVLARFDLTAEEYQAVIGIQADTLEQFAACLDEWITRQNEESRPLPPLPGLCQTHVLAHAFVR